MNARTGSLRKPLANGAGAPRTPCGLAQHLAEAPFHSTPAYYNTGSCVHPRCITGLEITPGPDGKPTLTLIKWGCTGKHDGAENDAARQEYNLSIKKEILEPALTRPSNSVQEK
jgi:hypothetical protein